MALPADKPAGEAILSGSAGDAGRGSSETPFGVPEDEYYRRYGVKNAKAYITNSRGMKLFTQHWLPESGTPQALIFACHGYGNDTSWIFQGTCVRFASQGYGVFGIDYEGHGRSEGLRCHVEHFDTIVDDCEAHFKSVQERPEYTSLRHFLYGESLGGAVELLILRREPDRWHGAIFCSPMLRISDSMKPNWLLFQILQAVALVAPKAAIVPSKDIIAQSFRDLSKRKMAYDNPNRYLLKPRLGTSLELLRVTADISSKLAEVQTPFLILHGEDDTVTDPAVSKEMFETAVSEDKTLKLYPKCWHQILAGEPDDCVEIAFNDIFTWLKLAPDPPCNSS
eukprot:SM000050S17077  [mRNA]  locus=s50:615773:617743:- [translate_table: standard]